MKIRLIDIDNNYVVTPLDAAPEINHKVEVEFHDLNKVYHLATRYHKVVATVIDVITYKAAEITDVYAYIQNYTPDVKVGQQRFDSGIAKATDLGSENDGQLQAMVNGNTQKGGSLCA